MNRRTSNQELFEEYKVGDTVITADGDIGRIVKLYASSPGWDDEGDWLELRENGEYAAGAVLDLGPCVGRFSWSVDYFSHYDGPVPENSQGFTAQLVYDRKLTGAIQ